MKKKSIKSDILSPEEVKKARNKSTVKKTNSGLKVSNVIEKPSKDEQKEILKSIEAIIDDNQGYVVLAAALTSQKHIKSTATMNGISPIKIATLVMASMNIDFMKPEYHMLATLLAEAIFDSNTNGTTKAPGEADTNSTE